MDFKAECVAGDQVECLGMPLSPGFINNGSSSSSSGGSTGPQNEEFLSLLRKVGPSGNNQEVWRARTTWAPKVVAGVNTVPAEVLVTHVNGNGNGNGKSKS